MWDVRPFDKADLDTVVAIQNSCPQAGQWLPSDYDRLASGQWSAACWVAADSARVGGFLVAQLTSGEMEILNLAVSPDSRRVGMGTLLLNAAISAARKLGARAVFLELRASNSAALAFYSAHDFRITGRRPAYYFPPPEDALLLHRDL